MEQTFSAREQIIEVVNKLFIYTDQRHGKSTQGKTREFVVSYDLSLMNIVIKGCRIKSFKYNFKFIDGNVELK